jgi:ATP-dependent helicase/nuclease subunit B
MWGYVVRPLERRRDDIFIWGLLEARLQSPDLMILCGLNEDHWPPAADSGPWLSRGMRAAIGLEPPERRQGQAAHDFQMALGNSRAVLAFAERIGTAPALPSRLVQRLEAFLGREHSAGLRARGKIWLDRAAAVDVSPGLSRATRPAPQPAAAARPRRLSVTEIETLIRSPYDIYARHVLRLGKLAPLGELPDARDRGTIVHEIFATFVRAGHNVAAPDALERLQSYAVQAFGKLEVIGERRDIWLHRFTVAARQFLEFERARQPRVLSRHAEIKGNLSFANGFELTGRADRVDQLSDGTAEILDFKTGGVPQPRDMADLLAPQLPLEALMLSEGGFEGLPSGRVSALTYIKIGLGPEAFNPRPFSVSEGSDLIEVAAETGRRLVAHTSALLIEDRLPMLARVFPKPDPQRRFVGDYDHLSRSEEWSVNEGDDSE